MTEERLKIKLKKKEDENALQELLYEFEMKKEQEIKNRIEKDQIRRALVDLEKVKLQEIGQEKKRELEKIVNEREMLKFKEEELIQEMQNLQQDQQNLEIMRKEELDRMKKVVDDLQFTKKQNNKVNEKLIEEKAEKIAQLKIRREQLENERVRINHNLEKIRQGDIKGIIGQNGNMGLVTARNIIGDMKQLQAYNIPGFREKIAQEENKIKQMKDDNAQAYRKEFIPYDKDEIYAKKENNFPNKVQQFYNQYQLHNNNLEPFRQNLEKIQQRPKTQLESYAEQKLNDLSTIKQDYVRSGGNDPNFMQNIDNLQRFYQTRTQPFLDKQQQNYPQVPKTAQIPQNQYNMMNNQNHFQSLQNNDSIEVLIQKKNQDIERMRNQVQEAKRMKNQTPNQIIQQQKIPPQQQQQQLQLQTANFPLQQNQNIQNNPFSIFTPKNEFFLHNEVRCVDLDQEERTIMNITQQEIDDLRVLSRIPVGTELYRFKMEQYKQLSTTRSEIEKIVQEQRLQKLRRKFELERKNMDRRYDNQRWIDDQRRYILAAKIRNDGEDENMNKDYDLNQGFIVHWDYILGLPRRIGLAQVVFGIYVNTQTLYQPKLVDPHDTEIESAQTVRCIIGDQNQVFDIQPDPETLIIMEVQIPYSKNLQENVGRTDTFGWTQVDIFDFKRQLKRGKFKCPLYYGPTDPYIPIPEIKNLEPIPGAWIFFRIAYPNDNEYGQVQTLNPEQTVHEYIIPQIHLRNIRGAKQDIIDIEGEPEPLPNINLSRSNNQQQTPQPGTANETEPYQIPNLQVYNPKPKTATLDKTDNGSDDFGGLEVKILEIQNHVARSHCRVQVALLEENYVIQDKNGINCTFNTSIHNPLDNKNKFDFPAQESIDLEVQNPHLDNMNNKEQGQNIRFQEKYKFLQNILGLYKKNKKDIWLAIQVVEKPEPVQLQDKELMDTQLNYAGLDYEPVGWNFYKIIEGGKIREGEQKIKLFEPPIRRPPVDLTRVRELAEKTVVLVRLKKLQFSDSDLKKARDAIKTKKQLDKTRQTNTNNNTTQQKKQLPEKDLPFIENLEQQWSQDCMYTKNMGIDFYIDGLRFLPDKVTVTKIIIDVVNVRYQEVFKQESCQPNLDSTQYNPVYSYRRELRKPFIDPTSFVLLTTITYDNTLKKSKCVGYSGIQLFINPYTKQQPKDVDENEFCIFEGYYQLPIYSQQIDRDPPFNIEKFKKLERIPCASILVRIKKAALSDDGLRSLSIKEFPQRDWIAKRLLDPKPKYSQGVYNTQFIESMKTESKLYVSRKQRFDQKIEEIVHLIDKNIKPTGMDRFLDEVLKFGRDTQIIDMMYFAKYDEQVGIRFSLDGLHKVPNSKWVYSGLISLFPPGSYYIKNEQEGIQMVYYCDLLSPAESPRFKQDFIYYQNLPFDRYLSIIVDIKAMQIVKNDKKLQHIGWTLVPLFSPDGYALSKVFQLPLIKGEVDQGLLAQMSKRDPWDVIQEKLSQKESNVKLSEEFTSIMVRVVDAQREGHLQTPYELERLDYRYLPQGKQQQQEWSYNKASEYYLEKAKKLYQNFPQFKTPPGEKEEEIFVQQLRYDFGSALGIEKYINLNNE